MRLSIYIFLHNVIVNPIDVLRIENGCIKTYQGLKIQLLDLHVRFAQTEHQFVKFCQYIHIVSL